MKRTDLREKVLYALAVASVATFVQGGGDCSICNRFAAC